VNAGLVNLAREALEQNQDRLETSDGCLRAAWPIRVRSRTVWAAVAELPVSDPASLALGRRLLAAVAEAIRARVEQVAARGECNKAAESLLQSYEEVSLLHHLGEILRVNRPEGELLKYVCNELRATIGAEATAAYLPAVEEGEPQAIVAGRLPVPLDDLPSLVSHLLSAGGPEPCVIINNDCQGDPTLAALSPDLDRAVLVPVPMRDNQRGALMALNRTAEEFGSPDAKLIRSTSSASAIFIENRRLYRELQQMMLDLVQALVSSVDAKDPYTCGHSGRVALASRRIAAQMQLTAEQVEEVYLAGLLHDIGKIGMPEAILQKEGRLTADERVIMNRHPEVGGRILAGIRKLDSIRDGVLYHHERMDGSGYPSGLKGDQIPLLARIIGLADAFDAMGSHRPYRPTMPLDRVRDEIVRCAGTQFDARAVEVLLGLDLAVVMREFAAGATATAS
jgi:hypothetical protein